MRSSSLALAGIAGLLALSLPAARADAQARPTTPTVFDVSPYAGYMLFGDYLSGPLGTSVTNAPAPFPGEGWESMFDGKTLTGWRETTFAGRGEIECRSGVILMNMGDPFTGLNWTNGFPKMNFEVALDAMRVMGSDFFCGLTVPVGDSFCSLIVGGWGGTLVGISSIDHMDASENETTKYVSFETGRWYRIRLRITENRMEAWIDDKKMADAVTTDRAISLRPGEIELSKPMGVACWQTSAALREIKMRRVAGPADPVKERK